MSDVLSTEQRSRCMSNIRSADTQPEILVRRCLWNAGMRYRIHVRDLPGRPDIVFSKAKIVVFIDGCFWHRCEQHYHAPRKNSKWWHDKIAANVARDRKIDERLLELGWGVLRFWEHDVRESPESVAELIVLRVRAARPNRHQQP